jgi:hypothetical protein
MGGRGRKQTLTDSEIKRNRSEVSSKWNKCRIYVRDQLDRCCWMERTQGSAQISFHFVEFRFLTLQISFHFVGFRFLTLQISLDFVFVSFRFFSFLNLPIPSPNSHIAMKLSTVQTSNKFYTQLKEFTNHKTNTGFNF